MLKATSKFSLGDIVASTNKKTMGVVTNIEATMTIEGVSIRYIVRGNEKDFWIQEKDAIGLVENKAA